ncbi:hypothetical protein GCM10010156_24020 [Planobispora rosea]|uniref:Uncharacterized protein n=1 Tax=Planobispora rosea TaxID=35762 RepID=A0A8J3RWU8_PLARO|nr:hypothetical protein [Planobispora rosea]GGS64148.1 hypothetical protein GCM10010156_24020 [Planobispora rosea]GIH84566.1 hypothetical protein Pro02_29740 [Planobispora rosea]
MSDHRSRCEVCGGVRPAQNPNEYTRERLLLIAEVGFCACRSVATADDGRPPAEPRHAEPRHAEPRRAEPRAAEPQSARPQPVGSRTAG